MRPLHGGQRIYVLCMENARYWKEWDLPKNIVYILESCCSCKHEKIALEKKILETNYYEGKPHFLDILSKWIYVVRRNYEKYSCRTDVCPLVGMKKKNKFVGHIYFSWGTWRKDKPQFFYTSKMNGISQGICNI